MSWRQKLKNIFLQFYETGQNSFFLFATEELLLVMSLRILFAGKC